MSEADSTSLQTLPKTESARAPSYVLRHTISFEETNLVGNVYFVRHLAWQGKCREMFLRDHAPSILQELEGDLRLVTLRCSCEYFMELRAFDDIEVEMTLAHLNQHRVGLDFNYRAKRLGEHSIARGFQEVGCMRLREGRLVAVEPPDELASALKAFEA